METKNILLIHNTFEPYRISLFNELAKQKGIHLTVCFLSGSESGKEEIDNYSSRIHFHWIMLPGIRIRILQGTYYVLNPSSVRYLFRSTYDVVILGGWQHFADQIAVMIRRLRRKPYIIWSDSTINEKSLLRILTRPFVQWTVTHATACVAGGTAAKQYLKSLGAVEINVCIGFNTVDVSYFAAKSRLTVSTRHRIRSRYLAGKQETVIVTVGQFIPRKGIDLLIHAISEILKTRRHISLWVIGQGPLQEYYRSIIRDLHLVGRVHIIPYVSNADMATYYGAADIFVLPSRQDNWGLVVNEAMACGLPVIVSSAAGSAVDLVRQGRNGYTLAIEKTTALVSCLTKLIDDPELRKKMGRYSARHIQQFVVKNSAQAFLQAINRAMHTI